MSTDKPNKSQVSINVEPDIHPDAEIAKPPSKRPPPPYVASLSPQEREKAEKALVRKIDLRLLPVLVIMYILNYLDRNNIVRGFFPLNY